MSRFKKALYENIGRQADEILSEIAWLKQYQRNEEIEDMENCVENIFDSLRAIADNIKNLKKEG